PKAVALRQDLREPTQVRRPLRRMTGRGSRQRETRREAPERLRRAEVFLLGGAPRTRDDPQLEEGVCRHGVPPNQQMNKTPARAGPVMLPVYTGSIKKEPVPHGHESWYAPSWRCHGYVIAVPHNPQRFPSGPMPAIGFAQAKCRRNSRRNERPPRYPADCWRAWPR